MTATAIKRVVVDCPECHSVAALFPENVPTWRAAHRCFVRPQGVIESEAKRAAADSVAGTSGAHGVSPVANGLELDRPRPPLSVFGDPTPPLNTTGSDYAEDDWQSLLEEGR